MDCTCHITYSKVDHELCCGHPEGRDPNCPKHGDGAYRIRDLVYKTPGGTVLPFTDFC